MADTSAGLPALQLSGIDLHYGFVRALSSVDFHVMPGEVVGLLGDNGAGKSTLLKVMSGAHRPSAGTIRVRGEEVSFHAPSDSSAAGIQMVYQDLALVEPQDISINLNIGREILRKGPLGWLGFVDHKAMRKRSESELDRLGVRTAPMTRPVEMLSGRPAPGRRAGPERDPRLRRRARRPAPRRAHRRPRLRADQAGRGAHPADGRPGHRDRAGHPQPPALRARSPTGSSCSTAARRSPTSPMAETETEHVVGWITGARASQFATAQPA